MNRQLRHFVLSTPMTYSTRLVQSVSLARSRSFRLFFARVPRAGFPFPLPKSWRVASTKACSGSLPFSFSPSLALCASKLSIKSFFLTRATRCKCIFSRRSLRVVVARRPLTVATGITRGPATMRRDGGYLLDDWSHRRVAPLGLPRALLQGLVRRRGKTVSEEKETGEGGYSITPSVWSQSASGVSGIDSLRDLSFSLSFFPFSLSFCRWLDRLLSEGI